jgi:putative methyltransferase (TIGR04325 family)
MGADPLMTDFPEGASGDFSSWEEAALLCSFDQPEFLEKVFSASNAVARGTAIHMRDGCLFDEIQYSWPLLAGLMYAAAKYGGRLVVLDFGGSLGATYFQNRRFLEKLETVEWHIVERDIYWKVATRYVQHPRLHFHRSIEACCATGVKPGVIVFSSVLQMLPDPWALLAKIGDLPVRHVLIDRCSISTEKRDRLTVFRASTAIVANMTRPMWFFDEARLLAALGPDFSLIERFSGFEQMASIPSQYNGYILERAAG